LAGLELIATRYGDKEALKAHAKSEGLKNLQEAVKKEDLLAQPMTVMFVKDVGGFTSKL
jgi:quinol monooxygenase YgiN